MELDTNFKVVTGKQINDETTQRNNEEITRFDREKDLDIHTRVKWPFGEY